MPPGPRSPRAARVGCLSGARPAASRRLRCSAAGGLAGWALHWFAAGQTIRVENCPTRYGAIGWSTVAESGPGGEPRWRVELDLPPSGGSSDWAGGIWLHIHPPNGAALKTTTLGRVAGQVVELGQRELAGQRRLQFVVA